jgi:hypothetical protein
MQFRRDPKGVRYSFNSLHELGEYIAATKRTWKANSSVTNPEEYNWDLRAGYSACVRMAQDGWLEGAAKVQEALKSFTPATPKPDTKTDFYGFRPHVPRFCAGAPDNMIRHTRTDALMGSGNVITLAVPVNALAMVSAKGMSNFGVAVAQYVNQMETEGKRVEVIGMMVSEVSGQRCAHSWIVKRAEQPMDLAVVAFSIGHPGMFRRLGFGLRERCALREDPGYGRPLPAKVSDLIEPAPGTIVLNGMAEADTVARTPADALAYIAKQVERAFETQEL